VNPRNVSININTGTPINEYREWKQAIMKEELLSKLNPASSISEIMFAVNGNGVSYQKMKSEEVMQPIAAARKPLLLIRFASRMTRSDTRIRLKRK